MVFFKNLLHSFVVGCQCRCCRRSHRSFSFLIWNLNINDDQNGAQTEASVGMSEYNVRKLLRRQPKDHLHENVIPSPTRWD